MREPAAGGKSHAAGCWQDTVFLIVASPSGRKPALSDKNNLGASRSQSARWHAK